MKLLVLRYSSAGDIILTSLFLRALRKQYPDAVIHYATKQVFAELVQHSPYVDAVLPFQDGWGLGDLARMKRETLEKNQGKYDVVFDLHNSLRSRYFRRGIAAQTAVVRKPTFWKWLLVKTKKNRLRPITPIPELYLECGKKYGLVNDGLGLELYTGIARSPIPPDTNRPTIALAPGARHATKRWLPEYYTELASELIRSIGARIVVLGGQDEQELCATIAGNIAGDTFNLAGTCSFLETAAALDECALLVSNDSALVHVAAARKRPVIAIFGSTVQEFGFAPYGTVSAVVEQAELECRPCTTIGRSECPKGHFRCMKDSSVTDVQAKAMELLAAHRPEFF